MGTSSTLDIDRELSTVYEKDPDVWKVVHGDVLPEQSDTTYVAPLPAGRQRQQSTEDSLRQPCSELAELLRPSRAWRFLQLGMPPSCDAVPAKKEIVRLLLNIEWATESVDLPATNGPHDGVVDWHRWHELLRLRVQRALTADEVDEYDRFSRVVARLDEEEAALARPAMEALVSRHERVLWTLQRLIDAVREAACGK